MESYMLAKVGTMVSSMAATRTNAMQSTTTGYARAPLI